MPPSSLSLIHILTITTDGYNYIAMNDDVYAYTGVTSANADQSNLGFLLCNMRTKETHFYEAPGATEAAARASAEGVVQDLSLIHISSTSASPWFCARTRTRAATPARPVLRAVSAA